MKFHEYANLFPMLGHDELEELRVDIEKNGLLDPVIEFEEKILDGRNRATACMMLGIKPKTVPYTGNDPLGFVLSKNLTRRHLTESQRAAVAAEIANMPPHRPKKAADLPTYSQAAAADKLNVSERLVRDAKKVQTESPELFEAVKTGEKTVSAAVKEIKTTKKPHKSANLPPYEEPDDGQEQIEPTKEQLIDEKKKEIWKPARLLNSLLEELWDIEDNEMDFRAFESEIKTAIFGG